jgi:hypothetical protein
MEMKKVYILTTLFLLLSLPFAMAQQHDERRHEQIEAARIAHISTRLNLSPEQAQKFWPVYNEFNTRRHAMRQEHRQIKMSARENNLNNEQARTYIKEHVRLEKAEAALDEEYYGKKLLSVLEPRQVVMLMNAEMEFKKMLLERLKDNKAN